MTVRTMESVTDSQECVHVIKDISDLTVPYSILFALRIARITEFVTDSQAFVLVMTAISETIVLYSI